MNSNKTTIGYWSYLSIEPIIGSGEFVNVGIVLIDEEGLHYEPILTLEKCNFLFGINGNQLYSIINITVDQLLDSNIKDISVFNNNFFLSGIKFGYVRTACYENKESFLLGIKKLSLFASDGFDLSLSHYLKNITRERQLDHFIDAVKTKLVKISKNYREYFNVNYSIPTINNTIRYSFSTNKYVSNISYVIPSQYLNGMVRNTMYKMVDLSILKSAKIVDKPKQYELILYLPEFKVYDTKLEDRFYNENEKIAAFANDNGIGIIKVNEPKSTAEHLLKKIVA